MHVLVTVGKPADKRHDGLFVASTSFVVAHRFKQSRF